MNKIKSFIVIGLLSIFIVGFAITPVSAVTYHTYDRVVMTGGAGTSWHSSGTPTSYFDEGLEGFCPICWYGGSMDFFWDDLDVSTTYVRIQWYGDYNSEPIVIIIYAGTPYGSGYSYRRVISSYTINYGHYHTYSFQVTLDADEDRVALTVTDGHGFIDNVRDHIYFIPMLGY